MTKEEDEKRLGYLKGIVSRLPDKPGSYQFYDANKTIIYVGKAKNLKARVSSYFHTEVDRYKTKVLVSKIFDISYTVVNTEEDALLLENSLIKKYNPRYNVLLKDSKTYPSICVTNEFFPRIFSTRTINKKWGSYYGPYSHIGTMKAVLDLIKQLYHPRTCRQPITKEGVETGKYKVCLDYHIKKCMGPCVGKQSYEAYQKNIIQAREILKGNTRQVLRDLKDEMLRLSEDLRFEEAEEVKHKYLALEAFVANSEVVSQTIHDVDVFSITSDDKMAFINYIHVNSGAINQSFTIEYKKKLNESDEELLQLGIVELRERFKSDAREIIVPQEVNVELENVTFTIPQRGDKKTLLDLSIMNGKQYKFDRLKQAEKLNPEQKQTRLMKELQEKLFDELIGTLPEANPGQRNIFIDRKIFVFDGRDYSGIYLSDNTEDFCIPYVKMNQLYNAEKRVIKTTIPETHHLVGYVPISIEILGYYLENEAKYTHHNEIVYGRQYRVNIDEFGEVQDLLQD